MEAVRVSLRFPHGTEFQWTADVPSVGQVIMRGSERWLVVSSDASDGHGFRLEPYDDGTGLAGGAEGGNG